MTLAPILFLPLFTGVRGRFIFRSSPTRSTKKLASEVTTRHTVQKIVHLGDVPTDTRLLCYLPARYAIRGSTPPPRKGEHMPKLADVDESGRDAIGGGSVVCAN
jgi:hypothetical protein